MTNFEKLADRFNLMASEMVWDEGPKKWDRVPTDPPISAEILAREKDDIKLWYKKFEEGHSKDTGPSGMCVWSRGLVKDTKDLAIIEGWCLVRDIVKLVYMVHAVNAAKCEANRQNVRAPQGQRGGLQVPKKTCQEIHSGVRLVSEV